MVIKMFTYNGLEMVQVHSKEELTVIAKQNNRWEIIK